MPDDRKPSHPPRSGALTGAPERTILHDGELWTVRLWTAAYDRRSRPDLVFEGEWAMKRVRNYPDNWHELSDEALFALSFGC